MVGGNALAHDAAGNRYELQVKIFDAERIDLLANLLDQIVATGRACEFLIVGQHGFSLQVFSGFQTPYAVGLRCSQSGTNLDIASTPREGTFRHGMQPAFGVARETERFEERRFSAGDLTSLPTPSIL